METLWQMTLHPVTRFVSHGQRRRLRVPARSTVIFAVAVEA
jgi:hypothetical protein